MRDSDQANQVTHTPPTGGTFGVTSMYVLITILIVFAVVSIISTMMALINFMWVTALISAVLSMTLLTGVDSLARYIDAR